MDHDSIIDRLVADAAPLQIRFVPRLALAGRNATYTPDDPSVQIRVSIRLTGIDRLATLAHQLGHAESHAAGRPEAYTRARTASDREWRSRPADEQRAILAAEVAAWRAGYALARRHGMDDAAGFLRVADERLATFRDKLDTNVVALDAALAAVASVASATATATAAPTA